MADWTGDTFVEGQDWTSGTGAIVATRNGNPLSVASAYNGHKAVDFDGSAYFSVPGVSNPIGGATAFTMVAVFDPSISGASGGSWWQSSGLIGMEQGGSVADWGFGWNGNQTNAGVGGPDVTMLSPVQETNRLQVAMFTWSGGTQKLYVNGVLVDSDTGVATAARNAGAFGLGAITGVGDNKFTGRIAELRIYNSDETANVNSIYTTLRDKYIAEILLTSSKLNTSGGTIVLSDTAGSKVNIAGTFTLLINGEPATVTKNKVGDVTTLNFTAPIEPNNLYFYDLTIPRLTGGDQLMSGSLQSYKLPLTLAGPAGAAGTWGIREYSRPGTGNIVAAADAATAATDPFVEAAAAPVFNHADPDTNGATSSGNFNNDFNILTNTAANDDFVVVGKTKVTVPAAGDYTFSVHSDDGFVMRVAGGRFTSTAGSGQIDPGDSQSMFLDGGTGDSNTRGTYHFDAAGTYDILYLGWDGGGGGYYEVAWTPGSFVNDRDTNTWTLVGTPGDPSVPAFRDRVTQTIPGPAGTNGAFGTRTYRDAATQNNLGDANNFLLSTTRTPADGDGLTVDAQLPYLNHRDPENGGGGLIPGDLPFPGNTGADESNVLTTAKARIVIPTTGTYTFSYAGDDGFMLRFKGVNGAPNPKFKQASGAGRFEMSHPNELFFDAAGTITTRGVIDLTAGQYDIDFVQFEGGGSFFYELAAASGTWLEDTTPPGGFQLVGFVPPAAAVVVPGIADPGWSVETAGPNTAFAASIAGAEARLSAGSTTSTWDTLNFWDPQDGSEATFPSSNPWPLNTPAADDGYCMRATGTINITSAGTYQLGFQGDDGGYMYIYGVGANPDPVIASIAYTNLPAAAVIGVAPGSSVNNAIRVDAPTGNSRTIVNVPLQVGQYQIKTLFFEGGGGSWWEVVGAKGPLDASFVHPLLARGAGTTINLVSGLSVVEQSVTPPATNFTISGFTVTGRPVTSAQFNFGSQTGATYTIQGSTNLVNWIDINTNVAATGSSTPFTVNVSGTPALSGQPKVFFRVVKNP